MKFKPTVLLLFINMLVHFTGFAQLDIKPVSVNPLLAEKASVSSAKLNKKASSDTLSLPFFDDFIKGPGYPDTLLWADNQVYVNNDFGINPPSYGVATFDQLNPQGNPWVPFSQFGKGPGDSLTSLPINLLDSGGVSYSLADSIYLSFFLQSKGLGDLSKSEDSIYLQFKNVFGNWVTVWRHSGGSMPAFVQYKVLVDNNAYLHRAFQFRFVTYTYLWGNNNHFHLDYIYLNKNRRYSDMGFDDYAVSSPPTNLLSTYSSMPYNHFLQNAGAYTADSIYFNVSNLSAGTLNIEVKHKETSSGSTLIETNPVTNAANVPAFGFSKRRFGGFAINSLPPDDEVIIERSYELREPSVLNPYRDNDIIRTRQYFGNYYAYDDGTAEAGFGFNDLLKGDGAIAIKYSLAKTDTIRALQIFFNQSIKDVSRVNFTVNIWQNLNNTPVYQHVNVSPTYTGIINGFYQLLLDTVIVMPAGDFYVGWQQTGNFNLNVGLDRNYGYLAKRAGANNDIFYRVENGDWIMNTDQSINGAPMFRVVVGKSLAPMASVNRIPAVAVSAFPNPFQNKLNLSVSQPATYTILNVNGQIMYSAELNNVVELNTEWMPAGLYLIKIDTRHGGQQIIKAIKQ